jgi:hypothetical protein
VSDSIDLPDVNVWLALGLPDHPHHNRALAYWNNAAGQRVVFCRITALGMVPSVFCVVPRVTYNEYAPLGTP